jgi:hypothetical protein
MSHTFDVSLSGVVDASYTHISMSRAVSSCTGNINYLHQSCNFLVWYSYMLHACNSFLVLLILPYQLILLHQDLYLSSSGSSSFLIRIIMCIHVCNFPSWEYHVLHTCNSFVMLLLCLFQLSISLSLLPSLHDASVKMTTVRS